MVNQVSLLKCLNLICIKNGLGIAVSLSVFFLGVDLTCPLINLTRLVLGRFTTYRVNLIKRKKILRRKSISWRKL